MFYLLGLSIPWKLACNLKKELKRKGSIEKERPSTGTEEIFSFFFFQTHDTPSIQTNRFREVNKVNVVFYWQEGSILEIKFFLARDAAGTCALRSRIAFIKDGSSEEETISEHA